MALEWPRSCAYWQLASVRNMIQRMKLGQCQFDGCAYGLTAGYGPDAGRPIRKPWRVVTDILCLLQKLNKRCPGNHDHVPCQGTNTKHTGRYTAEIARCVVSVYSYHMHDGLKLSPEADAGSPRMSVQTAVAACPLLRLPPPHAAALPAVAADHRATTTTMDDPGEFSVWEERGTGPPVTAAAAAATATSNEGAGNVDEEFPEL